jgi:energy-coupling factor transport system ATP-binding protein
MTPGDSVLRVERASFAYPSGDARVGPFDLEVRAGRLTLVQGPSGCGKSTLARLLCGVIPHLYHGDLAGGVVLDGRATTELSLPEITARVGAVFQNPEAQLLAATVADEVDFGLERCAHNGCSAADRRRTVFERFDLGHLADRDPRSLSGGEQQRVLIAAAAARRPELLVLDEPLSMLDRDATSAVVEDLAELRRDGTALVAFEHRRPVFGGDDDATVVRLADDREAPELPRLPPRNGVLAVRLEGVSVDLGGRRVLHDLDLHLRGGAAVAVLGANGAGKTTLLRALCGLQRHRGRISRRVDATERDGVVGLCFQNADHQIFNASVRDELRYGGDAIDEDHYRAVLALTGLSHCETRQPLLLSEGEKKRLAIGLLLMRRGLHGLCLDEPTLGQDAVHREVLGRTVRRLVEAGYLCVVATHDETWARRWCDRSIHLERGRIDGDEG